MDITHALEDAGFAAPRRITPPNVIPGPTPRDTTAHRLRQSLSYMAECAMLARAYLPQHLIADHDAALGTANALLAGDMNNNPFVRLETALDALYGLVHAYPYFPRRTDDAMTVAMDVAITVLDAERARSVS